MGQIDVEILPPQIRLTLQSIMKRAERQRDLFRQINQGDPLAPIFVR